jgi:hypothetical protein
MPAWLRLVFKEVNLNESAKYNFEVDAPDWLTSRLGYDFEVFPIIPILDKLEEEAVAGLQLETPWLVKPY